jgi:hypothetical protein
VLVQQAGDRPYLLHRPTHLLYSLLLAADIAVPPTYEINFFGVRRIPV